MHQGLRFERVEHMDAARACEQIACLFDQAAVMEKLRQHSRIECRKARWMMPPFGVVIPPGKTPPGALRLPGLREARIC